MSLLPQHHTQSTDAETPFFFRNGDYRLFGILHRPATSQARGCGVVICYPCFEEKLWSHRVFVSLARELAGLGFHVLRFDYMGHGDSDGDFHQSTVITRLSDISCAVGVLRGEMGNNARISLLGLRLGAMLAAMHADSDDQISGLVLWDPVVDGAAYMQEVLLSNLATQSAVYQEIRQTREDLVVQMRMGQNVSIEGYDLSHAFYDEGTRLHIKGPHAYPGPTLIVQTGRSAQKPKKILEELRNAYPCAELVMCTEEPFWKELRAFYPRAPQLFDTTFSWMRVHAG